MPNNAISGKAGYVSNDSIVIYNIKEWKLDQSADMLATTNFASSGHKEYIAGCDEWSGTFSGQHALHATASNQGGLTIGSTITTLKLYTEAGKYYSGSAIIEKISSDVGVEKEATISYSFKGTGVLTVVVGS